MVEVLRKDSEEQIEKHSRKLTRWQVFVFLVGCLRIGLINFFDVTNDLTATTDELNVKQMTQDFFIMGIVFWGNLVDNTLKPRFILVFCESIIALSYLICAAILFCADLSDAQRPSPYFRKLIYADFELDVVHSAFRSGIMIVTAI